MKSSILKEPNVWADLISRWGGKVHQVVRKHSAKPFTNSKRNKSNAKLAVQKTRSVVILLPRPWTTVDLFGPLLMKYRLNKARMRSGQNSNDVWLLDNRIWIPQQANELTLRLIVISHCGANGHRGMDVMESHLLCLYERPVDFSVGDYVLRSRVDEKLQSNKLLVTWVGPYRVTDFSE
ncbi:Chromodomain containing hypothetical protein [Phytophthora palmivora]|uniref:Uncharacterized protein n=1 Tax=Phytophthora palmivora TaxID=4796 RepID=A0A2P4Y7S8_9STRA|nr:Chromodomain containing hypothetical protein [Phytophthora palmivora]